MLLSFVSWGPRRWISGCVRSLSGRRARRVSGSVGAAPEPLWGEGRLIGGWCLWERRVPTRRTDLAEPVEASAGTSGKRHRRARSGTSALEAWDARP